MSCVSECPRAGCTAVAYFTDMPCLLLTIVIQMSGFGLLEDRPRGMSPVSFAKQFRVSWERVRKERECKENSETPGSKRTTQAGRY